MSSYTHHLGTSFFGQVLFKQKKEPGVFMLVGSAFSSSQIPGAENWLGIEY